MLRFGRFVLKSGRESPYFFDCGRFDTGERLRRLAGFYVDAIQHAGIDFDTVYGPAYKGIPLATSVAVELSRRTGRDVPWCFNRKEAKDHGEGGVIVGARPRGQVLIVDDVVSAGTATRESVRTIRNEGAEAPRVCHRPGPQGEGARDTFRRAGGLPRVRPRSPEHHRP